MLRINFIFLLWFGWGGFSYAYIAPQQLEVQINGERILIKKIENWQIYSVNGAPVLDMRAHEDLIRHVLDLLSDNPETSFDSMHDSTKAGILIFINTKPIFVNEKVHLLLNGKTLLDFRDRRMSSFEPDDVEELLMKGSCKHLAFYRNGDHWVWKSKPEKKTNQKKFNIDAWLEQLLSLNYDVFIDDNEPFKLAKSTCTIFLKGRKGRKEDLKVYATVANRTTVSRKTNGHEYFYKINQNKLKEFLH